jgi:predicted alpha/beta-fold hydrolase
LASIITLSFFLNNCNSEKRFGFREKVRVYHNSNSAKVIQKIQAKPITVLATSNENIIAPILKKEIVFTENIETKITSENQHSSF